MNKTTINAEGGEIATIGDFLFLYQIRQMMRYVFSCLVLALLTLSVGCGGDETGVVATQDEMQAHADKHGDLGLDPAASTDITD
ncbi:hypothetical protein [Rhodopirellula sp. MGV]|uniref:hypothetical protein n=1 Tax=Rhodopirellula sp. MGV TaxID=2023130 RepID=UPI00117A484D|nr:hypothetical protein [Rhodopirellula sp. MGV]